MSGCRSRKAYIGVHAGEGGQASDLDLHDCPVLQQRWAWPNCDRLHTNPGATALLSAEQVAELDNLLAASTIRRFAGRIGGMMAGTLALVGSGEFLDRMREVDAQLLARVGGAALARVVIIPTASVPDGPQVVARWIELGRAHFTALGVAVDGAPIATRADADDPAIAARIAAANFIYISGGRPGFLRATLKGTRAWVAVQTVYDHGGVLAGCSAGAMILGAKLIAPRLRFGWPWRFDDAFGLVPNTLILPHYDAGPAPLFALVRRSLPPTLTLLGIDEDTALISGAHGWQVAGRSGVEVARAGQRVRYRSGAQLVLHEAR